VLADRRGVSEAISFVLVFSLVVSTVGVVYAFGLADLQDVRDAEQTNNVQRAFDLLAENIDELVARSAPSRGTEIRLQGGTLSSGDRVTVNVSVSGPNPGSGGDDATPIRYDDGDTAILYGLGAVIRSQPDGDVFVREPSFVLDDDRFVIPVVATGSADRAVGGDTTVLVRTENDLSDVVLERTEPHDVTVNVTSPRAPLWESYFSDRGLTCDPSTPADVASCSATDVDRVYVVVVVVDVAFE
jgi:hypothetical protein